MRKSLQYLSDLHLERLNIIPRPKICGNYLALCGDIGDPFKNNYKEFIKYTTYNYEKVFLIAGNHEFLYNNNKRKNRKKVLDQIQEIEIKYNNLFFLNNDTCELDNYKIIGTTLWSKGVYKKNHKKSLKFLKKELKDDKQKIILSHYLPSYKLIIPKYKKYNQINYATNLEYLIKKPIYAWLCGHSHCVYNININGVYCGINTSFQPKSIIL
jgi:predicted MPP superfamily phosphohydrolase